MTMKGARSRVEMRTSGEGEHIHPVPQDLAPITMDDARVLVCADQLSEGVIRNRVPSGKTGANSGQPPFIESSILGGSNGQSRKQCPLASKNLSLSLSAIGGGVVR